MHKSHVIKWGQLSIFGLYDSTTCTHECHFLGKLGLIGHPLYGAFLDYFVADLGSHWYGLLLSHFYYFVIRAYLCYILFIVPSLSTCHSHIP